jgi:hypothetical protein
MKLLFISMLAMVIGCSSVGPPKYSVRELDFDGPAEGCIRLYVTSGVGRNQAEARDEVFKNVISAGGNAVVFHGGRIELDPDAKQVKSYTSHGIIYKCDTE